MIYCICISHTIRYDLVGNKGSFGVVGFYLNISNPWFSLITCYSDLLEKGTVFFFHTSHLCRKVTLSHSHTLALDDKCQCIWDGGSPRWSDLYDV